MGCSEPSVCEEAALELGSPDKKEGAVRSEGEHARQREQQMQRP